MKEIPLARKQKTEDRGQKTGDRIQNTEFTMFNLLAYLGVHISS